MKKVVIITKGGSVKTENVKNCSIADLYKKCKFRKTDNFGLRHTWKYQNNWVSLYSRNKGRANTENKYDLPPPIDKELYFGAMIVIKHCNKTPKTEDIVDFEKDDWMKLYEKLFGGFEDLGDEDSYSEEEEIPEELKTKHGYMKDGFVVSSSDAEEEEDEIYVESDEEEDNDSIQESDEEADYGGETEDEMEQQFEDDDDENDGELDDDPASELSEEEYNY